MIWHIGMHRAYDTDVVNTFGHLRKNLADWNSGFSRLLELERRFEKPSGTPLGLALGSRRTLTMVFFQIRLGIKGIYLRRPAIHEKMNDSLCFGFEMRRLGNERTFRC